MPVAVRVFRESPRRFYNTDGEVAEVVKATCLSITTVTLPTDAGTSPEAVAATQRDDVLRAWKKGVRDVAAISAATTLPEFSVKLRLWELKLGPDPWPCAPGKNPLPAVLKSAVRKCRPRW